MRQIKRLEAEKLVIDELVARQLRPKAEALKRSLREYRYAVEIRKEAAVIGTFEDELKAAIFENMSKEEETDEGFSIKKHYDSYFFRAMDNYVNELLFYGGVPQYGHGLRRSQRF